ncbi:phosphatase PAP2 family protein [Sphingomonas sp. CFBP 13720]|uniref:phosphatase PAP2 family protein n=1 Tax=Sphingomonas sp. CFBP 13720 TaxID=2775302 RepID=UPI001783D944|nr:phosphatase PAP2 family protein [Sphingomonas sp. CFBP 13720]MBD8677711.1 phosphatase PAP2 family protein [Sphingomonas sp. CFBP 13720]
MTMDDAAPLIESRAARRFPWSVAWIAMALAAVMVLLFLASRVVGGDAFAFDARILLMLRQADDVAVPVGSARLASAVRDVTALGSTTVLTLIVVIAALLLTASGRWRTGALVAAATALGGWTNTVIKDVVSRARPDLVPHLMDETSRSFPSGHAANSAIVYLTLATLVLPMVRGRAVRGTIVGAATLLVAAIGASRVYMGVHWPSDVLAGWLFGTLWALGSWQVELRMLRPRSAFASRSKGRSGRDDPADASGRTVQ